MLQSFPPVANCWPVELKSMQRIELSSSVRLKIRFIEGTCQKFKFPSLKMFEMRIRIGSGQDVVLALTAGAPSFHNQKAYLTQVTEVSLKHSYLYTIFSALYHKIRYAVL